MFTYLTPDGSWGGTAGILIFDVSDLSSELYEMLQSDPEKAYDEIRSWQVSEGKI
jgi:hypothetical protein